MKKCKLILKNGLPTIVNIIKRLQKIFVSTFKSLYSTSIFIVRSSYLVTRATPQIQLAGRPAQLLYIYSKFPDPKPTSTGFTVLPPTTLFYWPPWAGQSKPSKTAPPTKDARCYRKRVISFWPPWAGKLPYENQTLSSQPRVVKLAVALRFVTNYCY